MEERKELKNWRNGFHSIVFQVPSLVNYCLEFIFKNQIYFSTETLIPINLPEDVKYLIFSFSQSRGRINAFLCPKYIPRNFKELTLQNCAGVTDSILEKIGEETGDSLINLSLNECFNITDIGIKSLSQYMKNVVKLDLTGCYRVTSLGVEYLTKSCSKLSEIDLTECYGLDNWTIIHFWKNCSTLTILNLADCFQITWNIESLLSIYSDFQAHKNLKSLCLRNSNIQTEGMVFLSLMFPDLRILDLSWCTQLTNDFTKYIAVKLKNLFSLNLWGIKNLNDEGLSYICKNCTGLTSLTLCDCLGLSHYAILDIIANLHNLHTLNLWGCTNIGNACIQLLIRHITKLQGLGLSYCNHIMDQALTNISACTNLRSLELEGCHLLTDLSLKEFQSPNIVLINVRKCTKITYLGIEHCLRKNPNLLMLNISNCNIPKEFILQIPKFCSQLKTLNLSGIPNLDNQTIASILSTNISSTLTSLKLDECNCLNNSCIQEILFVCKNLQILSICFCTKLSDEAFSNLNVPHYALTSLYFAGCGDFSDIAIQYITTYFPKLKELIVSWNKKITDLSLENISNYLPLLRLLNVSYCNQLTDVGVKMVLEKCKNLRKLDISFCDKIPFSGLLSVAHSCKQLQVLRINRTFSESIFKFFEREMLKVCPNLKIDGT